MTETKMEQKQNKLKLNKKNIYLKNNKNGKRK